MKLRAKILLLFGLSLPILAIALHAAASRLLMRGFERIEAVAVKEEVRRAQNDLDTILEDLGSKVQDWAAWNDACRFIEDGNQEFIEANLVPKPLQKLSVDLIVIVHRSGKMVYNGLRTPGMDRLVPVPPGIMGQITSQKRLMGHSDINSTCQGILSTEQGLLMVASRPIMTSTYEGPVRGAMLFGRFLNQARLAELCRATRQTLEVHDLNSPEQLSHCRDAPLELGNSQTQGIVVRPLDRETVCGCTFIRGLDGRPVALLQAEQPRSIYKQGTATLKYLTSLIVFLGLVCLSAVILLLDRLVLSRLEQLSRYVSAMGSGEPPPPLPRSTCRDELCLLGEKLDETFRALLESQNRLKITQFSVDHAADAIFWSDQSARIMYVNEAACRSLGYTREELLRMRIFDIDPDVRQDEWEGHWRKVMENPSYSFESRHESKDGRVFPVEITSNALEYNGRRYSCAVVRDVTERKRMEAQLRRAALHDALTGLPNRAMLTAHLANAIERNRRDPDHRFAVMFLDFDHFKVINDSLGHYAGDQLLVAISRRLQTCLRSADVIAVEPKGQVARLGGDEFVILLEGIRSAADATAVAERIQQEIAEPFTVQGRTTHVTVSTGIVSSEAGYDSAEEMIRDADTAMYRAKNSGKARYALFDRQMHEDAVARLEIESELRQAIEAGQITVAYQPIVRLETGELEGFEALARWNHASRGPIGPDEFIPVAEETGLIVPLGRMVLEQACQQWRQFREQVPDCPPLVMSVNLSKRQLVEDGLVRDVEEVLSKAGIPAHALKLEVTESLIMEHAEAVTPMLRELKSLGLSLAMDDFGKGHSSLGCLHKFPIDYLKIDRSFISNMGLTEAGLNIEYTAIVRAIVTLAQNLGMHVVAEGVETMGQLVQLQAMSCDLGQGYYFSKPATAQNAAVLIVDRPWMKNAAQVPVPDTCYGNITAACKTN